MSGLGQVKGILLVLSGKGGVGKSTVSAQLACGLQARGFKVGLLDIDLCGPSIPRMLSLEGNVVHQSDDGWIPVYTDDTKTLGVMSIGFLTKSRDEPVIWRGPKKTAMIRQFLQDVCWGELDWLVIDTPPGTSDEHITIAENLRDVPNCRAVLVSTSQMVAVNDVRREITFCRKLSIPMVGIIENMSGYVCPNCSDCTNIFSKGGGKALAEEAKIPFLGDVPIDPQLTICSDAGKNFMETHPDSPLTKSFLDIISKIV